MMRPSLHMCIAVLALSSACTSEFMFTDSVDARGQTQARIKFGDALATPYAQGSEFTVYIEDKTRSSDMSGWVVQITDPSVLTVKSDSVRWVDEHTLALDVTAAAVGATELLLVDSATEVRGSAAAEVVVPTRAKLFAAAIAALDDPDFRGETPTPRLLAGGTAMFALEFLADDLVLHGGTPVRVETTPSLTAELVRAPWVDGRDGLRLSATQPGPAAIHLYLGEVLLQTFVVDVATPEQITAIDLIERKDAADEDSGAWLVVAQASDAFGRPIYGVDFVWEGMGQVFAGTGDVLAYAHDADVERQPVRAWVGGVHATVAVQAVEAEVLALHDEALLCQFDAHARNSWTTWLMLLGLGGLGWRRRRRAGG